MLRQLAEIVRRRGCCRRPRARRGVTSTEYAVMLALMLGIAMSAINCLGLSARNSFDRTGEAISGEIDE